MENVFEFRDNVIKEYSSFSRSFTTIRAQDIRDMVEREYAAGRYWPEPLIQINPNYQRKESVQMLVQQGMLHHACADIFLEGKPEGRAGHLHLFTHQLEAIAKAREKKSFVVTSGTGSGKSLSFFIPVIDRILKAKELDPTPRTRAIVIYPMNALANSQLEELSKFLHGYDKSQQPFTVARYTGQEREQHRKEIATVPPDILLTNFMMLELILTRYEENDRQVVEHCRGLEFLVLDELHTYRGRQGADVAMLVRRLRQRLEAKNLLCIGTSATMSSTGSREDQQHTVALVASKLFGTTITAHEVIGETLERVTECSVDLPAVLPHLKERILTKPFSWPDFDAFRQDPLAVWVELTLGIDLNELAKPKRAQPITLSDASQRLSDDAGLELESARNALQTFLISAHTVRTPLGRPPFAFKLHQFISGPGKVHVTLEPEGQRHVTLDAQRFAPGRQVENVFLYATHFCRECGQEYHPVWEEHSPKSRFTPRDIEDIACEDNDSGFGFLLPRRKEQHYHGNLEELPDSWLDLSGSEPKIKRDYKHAVPVEVQLNSQGCEDAAGGAYWLILGKFRFCLNCGHLHEAYGKDLNRLSTLSGEGRSSATTILTLSSLRQLFKITDWPENMADPRKILGFSDNRQDAALQAGHFNDFIFLLTLRSGLIGALQRNAGIVTEENLADSVFMALGFDQHDEGTLSEYLKSPKLVGLARQEAQRTLRFILGYRLLRDLRKGWRYNNPNLDQLKLLRIDYLGLDDFCADSVRFSGNAVLQSLTPECRQELARLVFDDLCRNLCLESRYLDSLEQDKARTNAYSYLSERWSFSQDERLATSKFLILGKRPEYKGKPREDLVGGGPRSRLVRLVKNAHFWQKTEFAAQVTSWKDQAITDILKSLLETASNYGYVQKEGIDKQSVGWRLKSSSMQWSLLREVAPEDESRINVFFRELYLTVAEILSLPSHPLFDFEAHEHTAQVEQGKRMVLEARFRFTRKDQEEWAANPVHEAPLMRLPVLFCSPTMELGVDISALNSVYMRNVPPTPANYAQRSGRAGRSGQPAFVLTYCAALSPHDQWFFHNANAMVHGVVKPPTLDLTNRDLIESHLQAIWLAEMEQQLDTSIAPLLDLEQENKPIRQELLTRFADPFVSERARTMAHRVMQEVAGELTADTAPWFDDHFVDQVIERAPAAFNHSLDRWRNLFDATRKQMELADALVKSHAVSHHERENARRRYGDAARQYFTLLKEHNTQNTDFYTYRFLASQGFLPGYNFPRLPLMAWIPGRSGAVKGHDEEGNMVSRPRFLALSEFGPRSLIYHEGRTYRVVRAKLNIGAGEHISSGTTLATVSSRVCSCCGYGHIGEKGSPEPMANVCENCQNPLTENDRVNELYRIETVETIPVERITVNDEERQRQGFELQTTYRFLPGPDGMIQKIDARVMLDGEELATLTYAASARIWRINRGWRRRKDKKQLGFYINPISGVWSKKENPEEEKQGDNRDEALLDKVQPQRIVPFVEDYRNILVVTPKEMLSEKAMATLQASLKRGIEQTFQIEEAELVAEPLPTSDNRRALLFYEAAEGGAGVLTRLANAADQLAEVANNALKLMHFQSPAHSWSIEQLPDLELRRPDGEKICEAGCYQCLLSYYNQPDHDKISRQDPEVLKLLVALANASVERSVLQGDALPSIAGDRLSLWLLELDKRKLRRPDALNVTLNNDEGVADAQYKAERVLVFLSLPGDGVRAYAEDRGYRVVLFPPEPAGWPERFEQFSEIFGGRVPPNHE